MGGKAFALAAGFIAGGAPSLLAQDSVHVQPDASITQAIDSVASQMLDSAVAGLAIPVSAPRKWEFTADLGLVNTAGNTEVLTLNFNQLFTWTDRRWKLLQNAKGLYSENEGIENAEYLALGVRGEYHTGQRIWAYVSLTYDRNPFADVGQRFEQGAGLQVGLVSAARDTFNVELGASIAEQATADFTNRFVFSSGRGAVYYVHVFSRGAIFTQRAALLPTFQGSGSLRFMTETSLVAPLTKTLGLKVSYRIQQDNVNSLTGTDSRIDRYLTTNLQVRF